MAVAPQPQNKRVRTPRSKVSVKPAAPAAPPAPPAATKPVRHQTVRLKAKAQVTIPYRIRRQLHLQEGDHFAVTVQDGKIVFEPVAVLDARWQKMLEEGLADVREGRVHAFESFEEGLEALKHAIGLD